MNFEFTPFHADCPDNDDHNVNTMDALTLTVPVILKYHTAAKDVRDRMVIDCIHTTRKTGRGLDHFAILYSDLLVDVLHGKGMVSLLLHVFLIYLCDYSAATDLKEAVEETGKQIGITSVTALVRQGGRDPMVMSCVNIVPCYCLAYLSYSLQFDFLADCVLH